MIPEKFRHQKCPAWIFFSKKTSHLVVDPQERPDPTGGYGKKVTAAPRRVFTAAASRIWIWSVDLGDDRAQDHVWIPNCPCRFELKKGVKKSGKYHFRDLCVSVRVSCISWCFGLKVLIFYEEGSKDPEVGSADLWKPSKREGHSRSLSSSDTSRSKRFKEQMEKLETQQKKTSLKTSSVTTK